MAAISFMSLLQSKPAADPAADAVMRPDPDGLASGPLFGRNLFGASSGVDDLDARLQEFSPTLARPFVAFGRH
jgi:hypothetical protein